MTGPNDCGRQTIAASEQAVAERMDIIADMRIAEKWRRSGDLKLKERT
jgi:hypothetical protein